MPDPTSPEQLLLAWDGRIRMLLNPEAWGGLLAALGIPCGLLTALAYFVSKSSEALLFGGGIMLFFLVIIVLVGAVIDLGGGFRVKFALTTRGVRSLMGRGARTAADAAIWTGILSGSLGAVGGGLLARAEQNVFIPFADVRKVRLRPGRGFIRIKGGFLDKPIGLYCTKDRYAQAETILRQRCPGADFA